MNFPDKLHLANLAMTRALNLVDGWPREDSRLFQDEWETAMAWHQHHCNSFTYADGVHHYYYPTR